MRLHTSCKTRRRCYLMNEKLGEPLGVLRNYLQRALRNHQKNLRHPNTINLDCFTNKHVKSFSVVLK